MSANAKSKGGLPSPFRGAKPLPRGPQSAADSELAESILRAKTGPEAVPVAEALHGIVFDAEELRDRLQHAAETVADALDDVRAVLDQLHELEDAAREQRAHLMLRRR